MTKAPQPAPNRRPDGSIDPTIKKPEPRPTMPFRDTEGAIRAKKLDFGAWMAICPKDRSDTRYDPLPPPRAKTMQVEFNYRGTQIKIQETPDGWGGTARLSSSLTITIGDDMLGPETTEIALKDLVDILVDNIDFDV